MSATNGNRIFGSRNFILEPQRWDPIALEAVEQRLKANKVRNQLTENAGGRSLPVEAYGGGANGDVEFDRRRDVRSECGWPDSEPTAWQYQALFNEDPLANRVVTCWPSAVWQVSPKVWETDEDVVTPFEQAVDDLCKTLRGEQSMFKGDEGNPLWSAMERCHVLSRIGQYGILYTGYDDGLDPSEPVPGVEEVNSMPGEERPDQPDDESKNGIADAQPQDKKLTANEVNAPDFGEELKPKRHPRYRLIFNAVQDPNRFAKIFDALDGKPQSGDLPDGGKEGDDAERAPSDGPDQGQDPSGDGPSETGQRLKIVFVRPYAEPQARITRWETNRSSPRYNQPVMYQITTNDPRAQRSGIGPPMTTINVHWTRVTHLPCNPLSSEVLGIPAMRPVLNDILDCRKISGASAEGYWKNGVGALFFETHPQLGGQVESDDDEMRDMMERMENSQQKFGRLTGFHANPVMRDVKDPTLFTDPRVDRICIALDFPKRIFVGSERGELASSQDDSDHNDDIKRVQNGFVTPRLIVPWFDRQIQVGALPKPAYKPKPPVSPLDAKLQGQDADIQGEEAASAGEPANIDDEAGDLSLDELMGDEGQTPSKRPAPFSKGRNPSVNMFCPTGPGGGVDPSCGSRMSREHERMSKVGQDDLKTTSGKQVTGESIGKAARDRYGKIPTIDGKKEVDGRRVTSKIDNLDSISASVEHPWEMPGIREVHMEDFKTVREGPNGRRPAADDERRVETLAGKIKESGKISPLIVVDDGHPDGPYILEGGHRFDALHRLGAKSFPALVVLDMGAIQQRIKSEGSIASRLTRNEMTANAFPPSDKPNPTPNPQPKPGQPGAGQKGTLHGVKADEEPGYHVEWPDVHNADPAAKAAIVAQRMTAAATYITGQVSSLIPEKNFLVDELDYTDEEAEAFIEEGELKQIEDEEKQFQSQKRMLDEGLVADPNNPDLIPDNQFHASPIGGPPGAGGPPGKPPFGGGPSDKAGPPAPGGPPKFGAKKPSPFSTNRQKVTENVDRIEMPQIRKEYWQKFLKYAKQRTTLAQESDVNPESLKAVQDEYDQTRVDAIPVEKLDYPILVSKDGYVLDGNHRWVKAYQLGRSVKVLRLGLMVDEALAMMREFPQAEFVENAFCPTGSGGGVDPSCPGVPTEGGNGTIKDKHGAEYLVKYDPSNKHYSIGVPGKEHLHDRGVTAGGATLHYKGRMVSDMSTHPEFRGKGLMTALYKHIEQHLGRSLQENPYTTPDGEAFWKSRKGTANSFCPTGSGGGVDPSCGTGDGVKGADRVHRDAAGNRINPDNGLQPHEEHALTEMAKIDPGRKHELFEERELKDRGKARLKEIDRQVEEGPHKPGQPVPEQVKTKSPLPKGMRKQLRGESGMGEFAAIAGMYAKKYQRNAFCPTGEGGGTDPTCSPGESAADRQGSRAATQSRTERVASAREAYKAERLKAHGEAKADAAREHEAARGKLEDARKEVGNLVPAGEHFGPAHAILDEMTAHEPEGAADLHAHLGDVLRGAKEARSALAREQTREGSDAHLSKADKEENARALTRVVGHAREGRAALRRRADHLAEAREIRSPTRNEEMTDDEVLTWAANAFCATGEGGGVDPSCGSGSGKELGKYAKEGIKKVWEVNKADVMRSDPSLTESMAGSVAAARILRGAGEAAKKFRDEIDAKVSRGEDITDEEDAKYVEAETLRKDIYQDLVNLSGYRPHQTLDDHPQSLKPVFKRLGEAVNYRREERYRDSVKAIGDASVIRLFSEGEGGVSNIMIHPSSRGDKGERKGKWQVTWADEKMTPFGDSQFNTFEEARDSALGKHTGPGDRPPIGSGNHKVVEVAGKRSGK